MLEFVPCSGPAPHPESGTSSTNDQSARGSPCVVPTTAVPSNEQINIRAGSFPIGFRPPTTSASHEHPTNAVNSQPSGFK